MTPAELALLAKYGKPATHYRIDGMTLVELSPTHCPSGHRRIPGRASTGSQPCQCMGEAGRHRVWTCGECDAVAVWPECRERVGWVVWGGI